MTKSGSQGELLHDVPKRGPQYSIHAYTFTSIITHLAHLWTHPSHLRPEHGCELFALRPRAEPGERLLRRLLPRPLRLEVVPGLAACQPRFALGTPKRLRLGDVDA